MNSPASAMEARLADLLRTDAQERGDRLSRATYNRYLRFLRESAAPEPEPFVIEDDLEGYETCPDPLKAGTVGEFVDLLGRYRLWAGSPSFREMQRRCRGAAAASTFCKMLKKTRELPAQHLVRAFIQGCAGDDQTVQRWITAWRRLQFSARVEV